MNLTNNIIFTSILMVLSGCQSIPALVPENQGGMVVLSADNGAYHPLAIEIAESEHASLVTSWDDALAVSPDEILWVISPDNLSDEIIIEAGRTLKTQAMLPSVGLISGNSPESARALWLRGRQLRSSLQSDPPRVFIAANGVHPTAGTTEPQLTILVAGKPAETRALDLNTFKDALKEADYLYFAGHGGDSYLRIDPQTKLETGNLPETTNTIIESMGCQTMRPWSGDSIAIDLVEQGAAAYAGFAYSPLAGYITGGLRDMPFRYTWPDFPIGAVAALENRAAMQSYADFPFFFVLGDPRAALNAAQPYDEPANPLENRTSLLYSYRNAPSGLIPVRITGGGEFHYVNVNGVADTADGDPFFNSRLQAASRNGDKYILFNHQGGDFTIDLRKDPPLFWWPSRLLTASWDDVALFTPLNGGNWIVVVSGLITTVSMFFRGYGRGRISQGLRLKPAILCAIAITLTLGVYQVLRLPVTSVNTKAMYFDPLWLAGVFLLSFSGCGFYCLSERPFAKVLALCIGIFPALLPAVFALLIVGGTNLLITQKIGAPVYNYQTGLQPLIAAAIWFIILIPFFSFIRNKSRT